MHINSAHVIDPRIFILFVLLLRILQLERGKILFNAALPAYAAIAYSKSWPQATRDRPC
jgi:hypothetical protein